MHRLNRMHIKRRRAGRVERCRYLARDDSALTHTRDHHPAATCVHQIHGAIERLRHGTGNAIGQSAQCFRFDAHHIFPDVFHGRTEC